MPRGGRRPGAGRKPKSAKQHFLTGNAGKRNLAVVPTRRDEVPEPPPAEVELVMPQDQLADESEQAYWHRYCEAARANGTLTPQTVGGFIILCQVAARADRLWEQIERDGLTFDDAGVLKAHPLLASYRGLVQRQESLLQRYLLAAMAKPDAGAKGAAPKEDDDSAALRQLMAIK